MADEDRGKVRIVDVDMPFGSMVTFMVKWAIASIPALIILLVIGAVAGAVIAGVRTAWLTRSASETRDAGLSDSSIARILGSSAVSVVPAWEVSQTANPIDDSPTVVLSIDAGSPSSSLRSAPSLILRCKSKNVDVYINWRQFLGSDETDVTVRLGRAAATRNSWGLSTDNEATFYPGRASTFITQLMSVDTLVAMTTPYSESPVTAVFAVSGLSSKIAPLREACSF